MASRKVKHARMVEKHERYMEEMKRSGLAAQEADHRRREALKAKKEQERLDAILAEEAEKRSKSATTASHKIHSTFNVDRVRNLASGAL